MPTRLAARLVTFVMAGSLAGAVNAADAQIAADLFDDRSLHEIRLTINVRDLQELRDRYTENVFVPADVRWRGVALQNVGVRSRGLGSRSPSKPGLKLDFNHYVSGQRFLGFESLVLDNLLTDPAMIRERIAMAFFERMGEPAPRESFARVYINGGYQGLYAIVEPVNGDFLERTGHNRKGYLFDRQFLGAYYAEDLGDDASAYRRVFEPRNHEQEADAILYSPIRDLFHEVNQPVDSAWRSSVERYLDLRQFVTHVAIETFLAEVDGVLGYAGMANFYLYRGAVGDRHRLFVWDKDHTFWAADSPIFQRASENALFSRAMGLPDLRALFLDVLDRCAAAATDGGWLATEIERVSATIAEAARQDALKPYSDDEHDRAVAFLREFAQRRPGLVRDETSRARDTR